MTIEFGSATSLMLFGDMEEGQWFRWGDSLCCKVGKNKLLTLSEYGGSLDAPFWLDGLPLRIVHHENIAVIVHP